MTDKIFNSNFSRFYSTHSPAFKLALNEMPKKFKSIDTFVEISNLHRCFKALLKLRVPVTDLIL